VRPGLSSFAEHPEECIRTLIPLIAFAKQVLADEEQQWPTIRLFVKATAGMRTITNLAVRDRIMNTVRDFLVSLAANDFNAHTNTCMHTQTHTYTHTCIYTHLPFSTLP
jgi:hypothetical protein